MNCFEHNDVSAIGFCKNCAKALCKNCYQLVEATMCCNSEVCKTRVIDLREIEDKAKLMTINQNVALTRGLPLFHIMFGLVFLGNEFYKIYVYGQWSYNGLSLFIGMLFCCYGLIGLRGKKG